MLNGINKLLTGEMLKVLCDMGHGDVLILAAGYATRLYPLTENFPKPLLDVGAKRSWTG